MNAKVSANAVLSAHTGVFVGSFDGLIRYATVVLGREIYKHELSDRDFLAWLRERVEPGFVALGKELERMRVEREVLARKTTWAEKLLWRSCNGGEDIDEEAQELLDLLGLNISCPKCGADSLPDLCLWCKRGVKEDAEWRDGRARELRRCNERCRRKK